MKPNDIEGGNVEKLIMDIERDWYGRGLPPGHPVLTRLKHLVRKSFTTSNNRKISETLRGSTMNTYKSSKAPTNVVGEI